MALPTDSKATAKDVHGFPLRACYRCGGTGHYSYNQRTGTRCFGCNGSGWVHPRGKVAKAAAEYRTARRAVVRPSTDDLEVGDVVTSNMNRDADDYRTIVAIEQTDREAGRWTIGTEGHEGYRAGVMYYYRITWDDGTTSEEPSLTWKRRNRTLDATPYLLQAGVKLAK